MSNDKNLDFRELINNFYKELPPESKNELIMEHQKVVKKLENEDDINSAKAMISYVTQNGIPIDFEGRRYTIIIESIKPETKYSNHIVSFRYNYTIKYDAVTLVDKETGICECKMNPLEGMKSHTMTLIETILKKVIPQIRQDGIKQQVAQIDVNLQWLYELAAKVINDEMGLNKRPEELDFN